tara:strand:- start:1924 stop:3189 length:1266 start_codon:yes stop_codon:yes gene_type:complete
MELLFSIIIPVYNSEKYLSSSLKSVLSQPFSKKKYEIILINDCSTDSSGSIIKSFKRRFKNIKVINNKINRRVSYCRNKGIQNAKGKYVIFLDSDDELKKNSLIKIENILSKRQYDLILSLEFKSNKIRINRKKISQINNVNSFIAYENKKHIYNPNCWNMVLNKSFLQRKKIFFKKIDIFEDQVFCTEVLFNVRRIKIIPGTFYSYIQRPLSLSRKTNYLALISCLYALTNFFKIIKNLKLTKDRSIFIRNRMNFIINNINKYIAICSKSQIKKVSFTYKKLAKKINIKNNIFYNNFFSIQNMYNLRKKLIFKVINYSYHDYDEIYIFGYGVIGRAIFHVLRNKKIKVNGFLDNDKNFLNNIYFGKKIISPQSLKLKINQQDSTILVIISQSKKNESKPIIKQLKSFGLENKNINIINIS